MILGRHLICVVDTLSYLSTYDMHSSIFAITEGSSKSLVLITIMIRHRYKPIESLTHMQPHMRDSACITSFATNASPFNFKSDISEMTITIQWICFNHPL